MEKSLDTAEDGIFFSEFLQRHPSDDTKTDSCSRWWPEWREPSWDDSCTHFDYGRRILLSPRAKPDLSKYGKFRDKINLLDPNVYLWGPFDFKAKDSSTPAKSIIPEKEWTALEEVCEWKCLLPPTIGVWKKKSDLRNVAFLKEILPNAETGKPGNSVSSLDSLELIFSKKGGRRNTRDFLKTYIGKIFQAVRVKTLLMSDSLRIPFFIKGGCDMPVI